MTTPKPSRPLPPAAITVAWSSRTVRVVPRPRFEGDKEGAAHGTPWSEDTDSTEQYYRCPQELVNKYQLELNVSIEAAIKERLFSHESQIVAFDFECFNEKSAPTWVVILIVVVFVVAIIVAIIATIKKWWKRIKAMIGVLNNKTGDSGDQINDFDLFPSDEKGDNYNYKQSYDQESSPEPKDGSNRDQKKSQFNSWF